MVIKDLGRAPLLKDTVNRNGMIYDQATGQERPGDILKLWVDLRQLVGNIALAQKAGMKFATRAATETYDKVREAADHLGVLIYPHEGTGKGQIIEGERNPGTMADVELTIIAQAISDGSCIAIFGYGQGADTQDKAGGKAGTYAFKQALIQSLLAGGVKTPKKDRIPDTDDDDSPIPGGPRKPSGKPSAEAVRAAFEAAQDEPAYRAALADLKKLAPDAQVSMKPTAVAAKARCIPVQS